MAAKVVDAGTDSGDGEIDLAQGHRDRLEVAVQGLALSGDALDQPAALQEEVIEPAVHGRSSLSADADPAPTRPR